MVSMKIIYYLCKESRLNVFTTDYLNCLNAGYNAQQTKTLDFIIKN